MTEFTKFVSDVLLASAEALSLVAVALIIVGLFLRAMYDGR